MSSQDPETDLQDGLDPWEESQIEAAILEIRCISEIPSPSLEVWDDRIHSARAAIALLERTGFMQSPNRTQDRQLVISSLQRLAYHDADGGGVADIAEWCTSQWLLMLQRSAEDISALRGLGQAWLAHSQRLLARIHRAEGSSSSGSSGRPQSLTDTFPYSSAEEARDAQTEIADADARAHTADYVEARGLLLAAVDYFNRALDVAERKETLCGPLLSEAAEASMSLGNVSYSHQNEHYFHRAIRYLRRASQIPGYQLSPYLQGYLDNYGRFVD